MVNGTTSSGFKFEVSETIADDFELLELIGECDENPIKVGALAEKLLGKEQKNALKEHVRGDDGIVRITDMSNELAEIFQAFPSSKN